MKKFWPDRYVNLTEEQKKDLITRICRKLQSAIDSGEEMPGLMQITPTLEVNIDNGGCRHDSDFVDSTWQYLVLDISVNFDAVCKMVDEELFTYPDFFEEARNFSDRELTDEEVMEKARQIYDYMRFDMDKYLEYRRRKEKEGGFNLPESLEMFEDFDFGTHCAVTFEPCDVLEGSLEEGANTLEASLCDLSMIFCKVKYEKPGDGVSAYRWDALMELEGEEYMFSLYDKSRGSQIYFDEKTSWYIAGTSPEAAETVRNEIKTIIDAGLIF